MVNNKLKKIFIILVILFIGLVFIKTPFHFHADGKYHKDCLECKLEQSFHSMEMPNELVLFTSFISTLKAFEKYWLPLFFISTSDLFIRPPPLS